MAICTNVFVHYNYDEEIIELSANEDACDFKVCVPKRMIKGWFVESGGDAPAEKVIECLERFAAINKDVYIDSPLMKEQEENFGVEMEIEASVDALHCLADCVSVKESVEGHRMGELLFAFIDRIRRLLRKEPVHANPFFKDVISICSDRNDANSAPNK